MLLPLLVALLSLLQVAQAQSPACGPAPSGSIRPSIASGYRYQVVATGLSRPRGLSFDRAGNLLVVESGSGRVSAHQISTDNSGCVSVSQSTNVTNPINLNHGIAVSEDGNTLHASNTNESFAWDYNAANRTVSNQRTVVGNMSGSDHSTRTLLLPKSAPGFLVVSFGSQSNLDFLATDITSGSASVKAFNLVNRTNTYNYQRDGLLLGWGLRNEVGVGEHPTTGGIWGVENSADQITRYGTDVHADNPGEELNFLGYLNGNSSANRGTNFGYPWCFSAWNASSLPENGQIRTGTQFAIDPNRALGNRNQTDAFCRNNRTAPRLTFQSHMAPLDIKFNDTGREAWITFHGSWNSPDPTGYKLSVVEFDRGTGEPVDPADSTTAVKDVLVNQDNARCPDDCFRPATVAVDGQGRVFMSSDASGEIYMVQKDEPATGTRPTSSSGTSLPRPTGGASSVAPTWMAALVAASFVGMTLVW